MEKELFAFLRQELPSAIWGYYENDENRLSSLEENRLIKLLEAIRGKYSFNEGIEVEACFRCLFRSIKKRMIDNAGLFKTNSKWLRSDLPVKEIERVLQKFKEGITLIKVDFKFNDEKIEFSGIKSEAFFTILFNFFENLENQIPRSKSMFSYAWYLHYFKDIYAEQLINKKRTYKKRNMTKEDFLLEDVFLICKEMNTFLKRNSNFIEENNITSNDSVEFIRDFINLTGIARLYDIQVLGNRIRR